VILGLIGAGHTITQSTSGHCGHIGLCLRWHNVSMFLFIVFVLVLISLRLSRCLNLFFDEVEVEYYAVECNLGHIGQNEPQIEHVALVRILELRFIHYVFDRYVV
jgi:hypothetical protein